MKDYVQSNKKGLIMVAIATIIMIGIFTISSGSEAEAQFEKTSVTFTLPVVDSKKEITQEERIELALNEYMEEINFYADTFQIDRQVLLNKIKESHLELNLLNLEGNIDLTLLNYLFTLEQTNKELFNNKVTPCNQSKEYIIALINYFSHVYGNVDASIASAIAEVESTFTSTAMLNQNNVFGGMANGRLIRYKNIEYGILRYIKLLNDGYFSKGLTTVESIGIVFNPRINESGVKIASPTWVSHVNNALVNYQNTKAITNVIELNKIKGAI